MSTASVTTDKPSVPNPEPISNANNPFDTVFDDEESDDEWWEDDTPTQNSNKAQKPIRTAQWPRPPGYGTRSSKAGSRMSIRKPNNRHSVNKLVRDKSTRRQLKQNVKAGIKVVTNLSRPQASVPVQIPPPKPVQAPAPQQGRFVDYAALKALEGKAAHTKTGGFWKSMKGKEVTKAPDTVAAVSNHDSRPSSFSINASTKHNHHLAPSPLDTNLDLSPCDRPIVIGLSIPSNETANHTFSPQTAVSEATRIVRSYEYRSPTAQTPETPTIIITPADGVSIWSALNQTNTSSNSRPRAASSVYSQAPRLNDGAFTDENAPPVPQMPSAAREEERQRLAGLKSYFSPDSDVGTMWEDESVTTKSRVVSSCTIFEEDESPILVRSGRARSMSGASKSTRHPSISTIGAQRQSTGWWNYITTPFITRTNTFAARDLENHPVPALPNLLIAAAKAKDAEGEAKTWGKEFSPLTPETSTTMASDRWWEDPKNTKAFEQTPVVRETRHKVETSTSTLPIMFPEFAGLSSGNTPSESDLRRGNTTSTFHTLNTAISPSDREIPMIFHSPPMKGLDSGTSSPQSQNIHIHIHSASAQVIQPMRAAVVEGNVSTIAPQASPDELPPPPYSPSPTRLKKMRPVFPPGHALGIQYPGFQSSQGSQYPASPGPISPGLQAAMTSQGAIPMSDVPLTPAATRRPINLNSGYPVLPERTAYVPFTADDLESTAKKAKKAEAKRQRHEKEDAVARRVGGFWRGRGCFSDRGCYGRSGAEGRKRRRWYFGLITAFLSIIIIAVVLATQLVRKSNTIEEPSQWLNLTGFPPIFTGLSTVAAPINIESDTGCVFPSTQWSCDLPKELHASVAPQQSNQPRFLIRIQWDNSTSANETFANVTGSSTKSSIATRSLSGSPVSAGQFVKHMLLKARQAVTFIPTPNPPKFAEQFFLGNTTDRIVSDQKAGEPTPFYISFLPTDDAKEINKRALESRQQAGNSSAFPDLNSIIPAPSVDSDGTASPANLLPFPSQQPIRLYDRGLKTEHYSFYTYYDRSIFLKSVDSLNGTNLVNGEVPDDKNGGARESEAKFRCTWRETRFMVQMWTRMNTTARLLNSTRLSAQSIDTGSTPLNFTLAGQDFNQPGTFPYPTTITVDRHGGDPKNKMLYCYKMNDRRGLIVDSAQLFDENRGFGGTLINKAPNFLKNSSDLSLGGFDGGTGGCACKWRNFDDVISA